MIIGRIEQKSHRNDGVAQEMEFGYSKEEWLLGAAESGTKGPDIVRIEWRIEWWKDGLSS